jgi:UDP-3-O-acyl-N-acetylglucosamine deacetylase
MATNGRAWSRISAIGSVLDRLQPSGDRPLSRWLRSTANDSYIQQVSRAGTFGFVNEVSARGRAGHGRTFENAIVMDEYRVLTPTACAAATSLRSKILDGL